jgi:hypothetical protein
MALLPSRINRYCPEIPSPGPLRQRTRAVNKAVGFDAKHGHLLHPVVYQLRS